MARPPKLTRDELAYASERLRRGQSTKAALAAELGLSAPGLAKAVEKFRKEQGEESAIAEAPPKPTPEPVENDERSKTMTDEELKEHSTFMIRKFRADFERLDALGEDAAAWKASAEMHKHIGSLRQLIKGEEQDVITIPRSQLEEINASARAKWRKAEQAHAAIKCSRCARDIATSWAQRPLVDVPKVDNE